MSIVFTESFDHYGTTVALLEQGKWTDGGLVNAQLVAGGGRCGTTAYRNTSTGAVGPSAGLVVADQFSWGQVAIRRESMSTTDGLKFQSAGGADQAFFNFMSDGSIQFRGGPVGTFHVLIASSAPAVYSMSQVFVFEWEVTISATVGTVQAWVDGVEVIARLTGLDTRAPGSFGVPGDYTMIHTGIGFEYFIDDVLFGDGADSGVTGFPNNARIGPVHITALLAELDSVAGGGFHKDFSVLSSTDHGAMVDDNPPDDDTSYNFSPAPTQEDTYTFPDIKIGSGDVFAVNILPMVKKSDAMNVRQIKPMFRVSAADTILAAQAVPDTQYEYRWEIAEGVGATPWSVASVNAAEFGLQDFS